MCGFCGVVDRRGAPVDPGVVRRMTASIAHRGPDDEGVHLEPGIGLGFRRLSIIDLEGGHQPMSDDRGAVHVVFNGEIFNFVELRDELRARGHEFRTRSDTEVLVHGYRAWGLDLFRRLNGMFGVAVWDRARRRLVLARDRGGVKPVYWAAAGPRVVFGSEIRAVAAGLPHPPEVDVGALALFLRYRYTPAPWTVHAGVRKLPPGAWLVVDDEGVREGLWWDFAPAPRSPRPRRADAVQELAERYDRAVERQLMSDVPLGLLLSGGLDSGLLLALASRRGSDPPTFTVGFGSEDRFDETAAAAATARHFGARHVAVRVNRSEFDATLPHIVDALEEPVGSPSVVPMWFVCERARRDVKVVLAGQGPDELFGGYRRHLGIRYGHVLRAVPSPARTAMRRLLGALPRATVLERAVDVLTRPDRITRWAETLAVTPDDELYAVLRPEVLAERDAREWPGGDALGVLTHDADELSGFQYVELRSSLPEELLLYTDKLSMAHGLEVRVPYLDHEIVEYALGLPPDQKIRRGVRKWVHREVCRALLPPEVLRRPKRGFAVHVVDRWYRSSARGLLDDVLLDPGARLRSVVDPRAVEQLVREHRSGREDHHRLLHGLVVAELWLRGTGRRADAVVARPGA